MGMQGGRIFAVTVFYPFWILVAFYVMCFMTSARKAEFTNLTLILSMLSNCAFNVDKYGITGKSMTACYFLYVMVTVNHGNIYCIF